MECKEDGVSEVARTPRQDINIFAKDDVNVSELSSLEGYEAGVIHGARRVDEVISSAGDHEAYGAMQDMVHGEMHQGEDNTENVARTLIARLNQDGTHHWGDPQLSKDEYWVDRVAQDGEKTLKIQITRFGGTPFYHDLSVSKCATTLSTAEEAANRLKDAIEAKRGKMEKLSSAQRGELTLALDAVAFLTHTFDPVIYAFRRKDGEWARQLGLSSIWIVGLSTSTTHRLDLA
jgi:hypothetical protein